MFSYCFPPAVTEIDKAAHLDSLRAKVASCNETEIDEFLKQKVCIKVYLEAANFDVDTALSKMKACSQWRQANGNNGITLKDIKYEVESCIARWVGFDIKGRPVLVITPRLNYSIDRKQVLASFKKFFVKTIELGIQICEQVGQQKVVIVYDRRELQHKQIDGFLYTCMREMMNECRDHYSSFLDKIIALDSNIVFWTFYHFVLKPLFYFSTMSEKVVLVDYPEDVYKYIDAPNCHLLDTKINSDTFKEMIVDHHKLSIVSIDDNSNNSSCNSGGNNSSAAGGGVSNSSDNVVDNSFSHFVSINTAIMEYYKRSEFDSKFD